MEIQALKNIVTKIKNENGRLHHELQIPKDIINKTEDRTLYRERGTVNKNDGKSTKQT